MPNNKKLNIAVLGAGNIAGAFSTALKGIKEEYNLAMYAVASRNLEKADAFAGKWGYERAYGSYEDLASDDNVDLIYIATPHSEHYKNAKMCLEHGRNLLVEKAFTANLEQTLEIIELARANDCFLAEAMWTRYQPAYGIVKDMLDNGEIGKIHYVESDFSVPISHVERLVNPILAGGALLDLGVYSITVAAMYMGYNIRSLQVDGVITPEGVDATNVVKLTYADGTMVRAKSSFVDSDSNYVKFVGSNGYLVLSNTNCPETASIYDINGTLIHEEKLPILVNGYEYEIIECAQMIREGKKEAKSMPLSETIRIQGWMDSIRSKLGVIYPWETEDTIKHDDTQIWGISPAFSDEDPWDRSNTTSYLEIFDITDNSRKIAYECNSVIEAPNWSHDGSFLTFNGDGLMYKFDLATGSVTQIPSGNLTRMNNDHVLSCDDKFISVSDESNSTGKSRIHTINIETGETTAITPLVPSYLHGISPDDKYMSYCAERNGEYDVYEIEVGKPDSEVRLTTAPGLNDGPEYDSKGEYIYFNSVRTGLMQAWRMKKDGTKQTQLTFDSHLNTWFPHISPDRSKIVMVSYRKGDLWPGDHVPNKTVELRMMDADGSNLKTLATVFGGQGTINVNSWSPDSKKFAFVSYKRN
ncbi:MAG: Gfo/Idh/MocA family oxidoreductase [Saccharofermentans sp.]|nr:Gfo/Idh/MocA family oxidoreductase [Saccharofermentans sp.]